MAENKFNRYWALAAILLVAIIIIGGIVIWSKYRPAQPLEITLPPREEYHGQIYIGGAVNNPGYYPYTSEDNLESLIQAAGGVTVGGNSTELMLHISAPDKDHQPQRIDINRADAWLLEALPGIGETLAQRIIDYRQQNGLFLNSSEIVRVEGIGDSIYDRIKDLITVASE